MSAGNRDLEEEIEEIDDLPRAPRPPMLAFVTVHKVCSRAVRSAMGTRAEEERLSVLTRHVRGMEPRDPATTTLDGWARLGAVRGAILGWRGETLSPPRDAPTIVHGGLYMAAGAWAWGVVAGTKDTISKGAG
jgi:hypothetical protein